MNFRTFGSIIVGLICAASTASAQDGMAPAQQDPPQQPTTQATRPATRSLLDIQADAQNIQLELAKSMNNPAVLTDARLRGEAAPSVVPQFKRLLALMDEAAAATPDPMLAQQFRGGKYQVQSLLVAFGDQEAIAALQGDPSPEAQGALAIGNFISADTEEAKLEVVKRLDALADQHPENAAVGQAALSMYQLGSEKSPKAAEAAAAIVTGKLKGALAPQFQQILAEIQRQEREVKDFRAKYLDKPLTIEGLAFSGEAFSTDKLKGKVVLVDFWATSVPPSYAQLPQLKQEYKQYHEQGLEVVGINLDTSAEPLKLFLQAHPDANWTQIYTEGNPQASAQLAQKIGIPAIPTVMLIDRNGVVRAVAVGGGEQMEKLHQMIPDLLKEEPKTP